MSRDAMPNGRKLTNAATGAPTQGAATSGPAEDRLAGLLKAARDAGGVAAKPLPVESWDPPYCGDIGLEIRRDGTWMYQGSPIGRLALVKLFSRVLRKDDDGRTYLVTPAEKVDVRVADAPFLAVDMAVTGEGEAQCLTFRTNLDDVVQVDRDHPLRFVIEDASGGLKPYIRVRGRLDALVTRAVYADLIQIAAQKPDADPADLPSGIWSGGIFWPFPPDSAMR